MRNYTNLGEIKNGGFWKTDFIYQKLRKTVNIGDHFEALQKIFQMRRCWLSYFYPFRNGIGMKTGCLEFENSLTDLHVFVC